MNRVTARVCASSRALRTLHRLLRSPMSPSARRLHAAAAVLGLPIDCRAGVGSRRVLPFASLEARAACRCSLASFALPLDLFAPALSLQRLAARARCTSRARRAEVTSLFLAALAVASSVDVGSAGRQCLRRWAASISKASSRSLSGRRATAAGSDSGSPPCWTCTERNAGLQGPDLAYARSPR